MVANSITDIINTYVQNVKDIFTFYVPNAMILLFTTFFAVLILLRVVGRY